MKLFVFSYRMFDEKGHFESIGKELGVQVDYTTEPQTLANIHQADGYDYISIITTKMDEPLLQECKKMGIKMISTRTIGFDHIDMKAAKKLGIRISNAAYSTASVADYTIMLMLMTNRKMKRIMERASLQDYSLNGILGREMHNQTVGVIGTGRIGRTVINELQGFGCKILAYDLFENEEVKRNATYVSFEELLRKSDIVTLHMPATERDYHMIGEKQIAMMKQGACLINTARGALIDSKALIAGIESGKLGGAGLDVVEKELGMYYYNLKNDVLNNRELAILRSFPNVVVTPHMAFYTDQAIHDMVYSSLYACLMDAQGKEHPYLVLDV